jgi:Ion transport protein
VLRSLRVLRVLRLITGVPTLRRAVAGLLAVLPGMGSIVLLVRLIYYVFAVMATKLFGGITPTWSHPACATPAPSPRRSATVQCARSSRKKICRLPL